MGLIEPSQRFPVADSQAAQEFAHQDHVVLRTGPSSVPGFRTGQPVHGHLAG